MTDTDSRTTVIDTDTTASPPSAARTYPPSAEFAANANLTAEAYQRAAADPEAFWAEQANRLTWATPFTQVLDWSDAPHARWFADGTLNVAYNCVDRHVAAGHGDTVAIHWEGEPGDSRTITYAQLQTQVCKTANALLSLGLRAGDRVAIYLPMIPEAVYAMLACARLGLAHGVVFAGFSAHALALPDRRRRRPGRDHRRRAVPPRHRGAAQGRGRRGRRRRRFTGATRARGTPHRHRHHLDRQGPLVGRTGRRPARPAHPGGIPGRTTAVRPLHLGHHRETQRDRAHLRRVPHPGRLHPPRRLRSQTKDSDVYWCTADIGWITGHSYIVYGPLANGATQVIYEGTPNTPHEGRHWEIIDKYQVSIYYTAPTLIRTFMKWGEDIPGKYTLDSLRVLGSVGEPINPEAWMWYRHHVGHDRCPIVDTWWQTETGGIMISPLPGVTATKPGSAMAPVPGISAIVVNDEGHPVANGESGYLVIDKPWPAMLRTIFGDDERYKDTYWSRFAAQGYYFAGDGAKYDTDGALWLLGRVDDVMNVSGHRISTTEVESALVSHPAVAEAAVVGAADEMTGQSIVAFVILRDTAVDTGETLITELRTHIAAEIGPIAKPKRILVVQELPKTRSGKIMRRLLRDIAENRQTGDVSALQDTTVMTLISTGLTGTKPNT